MCWLLLGCVLCMRSEVVSLGQCRARKWMWYRVLLGARVGVRLEH